MSEETKYPYIEKAGLEITPNGTVKKVCYRCLGSGQYSFNYMHGSVCYGCAGKGHNGFEPAEKVEKRLKAKAKRAEAKAKKLAAKKAAQEAEAATKKEAFLAAHPEVADALKVEHKILADLAKNLDKWGSLTEKQIALALKIAGETLNPVCHECGHTDHEFGCDEPGCTCCNKAEVEPGRRVMVGRVLTVKERDSQWGISLKMLVKLSTGEKLWGTVPSKIKTEAGDEFHAYDWSEEVDSLKGRVIRFKATVEASPKDIYFGFMKRPADCVVLDEHESVASAAAKLEAEEAENKAKKAKKAKVKKEKAKAEKIATSGQKSIF